MNSAIKERSEKIEEGIVPEGYKKTKVGIIPEDWEVKKLGEISNIYRGASPRPISDPKWFDKNSNIGWIRISDLTKSDKYLYKTEQYLSKEGIKKSRFVEKNNIIMSICATVGKPIITKIDACIHDGTIVYQNLILDKMFLYYYLDHVEDRWSRYGQTGSQMNLNVGIVSNEQIPNPPLKEQEKISDILSTWDKAIEIIEKLIKEKEEQKKGLMQKLLTGETRLPGFHGEWEEVKLGEVLDIQGGYAFKSKEYLKKGGIPIIRISNIQRNIDIENDIVYYNKLDIDKKFLVEDKDLLIAMSGATTGKTAVYRYNNYAYLNQRVGKFVPNRSKLANEYLIQIVNTKIFAGKLSTRLVVGAQPNISGKDIEILSINLPPLQEQEAIADILSTADKEIELLRELLEAKKNEKKGLMQLLLTGIVRV